MPIVSAAEPGAPPSAAAPAGASLFRSQALARAHRGASSPDVLRLSPRWANQAYWLLLSALVLSVAYGSVARVFAYAGGPAIVWTSGTLDVTASVPATLASVEVEPGDEVQAGQVLVRFRADAEAAELGRLKNEFEWQLVKSLRDPKDEAARQALATLAAQRDLAASQLERMSIRAAAPGVIGDVRARAGQAVSAGDVLLTLTDARATCSIWALLPGQYRPELRSGVPLRFDVAGYRYAHQTGQIESVGARVIGPREARRYLGNEISDAVSVDGPVVLVKAALPSCSFLVDGDSLQFHHGMSGQAEVRITTDPLWTVLFPNLRGFFGRYHD
jgi:membrane fusion protein (multidrug efflux system)